MEDDATDFRDPQATITSSALSLDNKWAMRDMSRSDMTQNGWEMRTLVRLHTEVHLFNNLTTSVISQEYFLTLSTQNLLLAGDQVSRTIFDVGDAISKSATEKLLRSFKADIASTYNWGGNEMTVRLAMAIISPYFAHRERIDRESSIHNLVMQLHRWVLKVVINRKLSSSKARVKVAMLLLFVSRFDLGYGKEADESSTAGMRLIQLIKDPDARVKFVIGSHIDRIFLLFPPSARVEVYRDMVENLEGNESQSEGFALRAYTLMHLALASDDIRRAALVNLLELGKFSSCMFTVQACFVHLAERLYGGQIAELFFQNSSQFIFSWIDFQEDIFQFPFHCFGYSDFKSWTLSVKDELVAQLVNANKWEDAAKLFRGNSPFDEILLDCLPRIVSYSHLMQTGVSDGPSASEQCEAAVGKDVYTATLTGQFARSVAIMIERFDDRTLSSESFNSIGLGEAPHVLSNTQLSPLGPSHPEPPQPSYDLRKVSAAIEYLRQELNIPPQGVWSPANTTFVIRQLVTLGVETSDSTVALSFLRRIVLVLCLAGKSIIDGYTLEMLLFSLKEFISRETMCQDTLEVIKYIFSRGSVHFDKNPERLRDAIAVILPPVQTLLFAIPDQQKTGIIDIYVYLERLMLGLSSPPTCLRATAQMLAMLQKVPLSEDTSVGQIIDAVISENQRLWGEERLCYFALSLLSGNSNVFLEPLPTLRRLVLHFLNSEHVDGYAADSKIWLGLAIGRVSMDPSFTHPEHHSMNTRIQTTDDLVKSRNAIMCETISFMRCDSSIAGLLEQALRHMISCSPGKRLLDLETQQYIAEYLWSPHINAHVNLFHVKQLPPPSAIEKWGSFDGPFVKWHKDLACSIAQHLPARLYATLIPSINASKAFCDTIFPFLVDEYCSQDGYDGSISKIFNAVLEAADSTDLDYSRLVIRTILILRKRPSLPSKGAHQLLLDHLNYLYAATAAVACKMFKTALMFLEIHWNPNKSPPERLSDQTLFSVYSHIDDPDLTYALSQSINRSWARLLDVYKLHHDRDGINGLRQARLRSKVELGVNPSVNDDDLRAVADSVRQNGFPLRSVGISSGTSFEVQEDTSSLYKTAWRLGTWDLPPLTTSKDSDTLLYAVLYHLVQPKLADEFSNVLDSSIVRVVDRISDRLSSTERSKKYLCLSMFANVKALFSNLQPLTTAARGWALQIKEKAQYGRCVTVLHLANMVKL
jgi:ataxia telangiectasia mutated family protein